MRGNETLPHPTDASSSAGFDQLMSAWPEWQRIGVGCWVQACAPTCRFCFCRSGANHYLLWPHKVLCGQGSPCLPWTGTVVSGWLDWSGLLSTFVNDHCQVLLGLQEKGYTWLAEQLYSITNPNAVPVGGGLNTIEQYQAQADTFRVQTRRLEKWNEGVQESHAPRQLQPWRGCSSKCYSLS